jgi:hypothetical protein
MCAIGVESHAVPPEIRKLERNAGIEGLPGIRRGIPHDRPNVPAALQVACSGGRATANRYSVATSGGRNTFITRAL